jgi:replicative DNA helicase
MKTNIHPLDNSKSLETIFGFILTTDKKRAIDSFNKIQIEWLKNPFHKRVHEAMNQLIKKQIEIDLLSLALEFRHNGWMENGIASRISQLTNSVNTFDSRLYIENVFNEMRLFESIISATSFRNEFDTLISTGNMTIEKFNQIVNGLQKINFDFESNEKTNPDVIFEIMIDHENAKNGKLTGLELEFKCLKHVVLLEPVDVMVIGARPAMGKTAFGISMMVDLAKRGKKIVFFALEMSKKQMFRRIMANLSGIDSNKIKFGNLTDSEINHLAKYQTDEIMKNIFVIDGSKTINDIANNLSEIKQKNDIDLFVVDYLQKIQPKTNRSRYESVSEISNGIKLISQNMLIPCVAFAQLSRDSSKTGKRPTLPDLKESGEIEQDASIVAFLHRPEYYGETETFNGTPSNNVCELIVGKNREGDIGIFEIFVNLATSKFIG